MRYHVCVDVSISAGSPGRKKVPSANRLKLAQAHDTAHLQKSHL